MFRHLAVPARGGNIVDWSWDMEYNVLCSLTTLPRWPLDRFAYRSIRQRHAQLAKSHPTTQGTRLLDELGVSYDAHRYRWEKGGAKGAAKTLGMPEEQVIKTLVFETSEKSPLMVLMDGTHDVSTKNLARHLAVKSVAPCDPQRAESLTGYRIGGISPFGTRQPLPVYIQEDLLACPTVYINAGKRGFLISLSPDEVRRVTEAEPVDVAIPAR